MLRLIKVFWGTLFREGPLGAADAVMFHFLNDGMKPSLWHTWYSVFHENDGLYSGIYPRRAPRNRSEAIQYDR
jgi:hypothetical protein